MSKEFYSSLFIHTFSFHSTAADMTKSDTVLVDLFHKFMCSNLW